MIRFGMDKAAHNIMARPIGCNSEIKQGGIHLKRVIPVLLLFAILLSMPAAAASARRRWIAGAPCHMLERETGTVIWEKDADARVARPASRKS
jgi:D-alanyl-D-alanine carboxypeptidase